MSASDSAPDDAEVRALPLLASLVDVSDPLAEVKLGLLLGVHPLDPQERGVILLVSLAASVSEDLERRASVSKMSMRERAAR